MCIEVASHDKLIANQQIIKKQSFAAEAQSQD